MAYSLLKDEARAEDRLIRSFGHDAHIEAELDATLGFVWTDVDDEDEGVATHAELVSALSFWNERL